MQALFAVWAVFVLVSLARPFAGHWPGAAFQLGEGWSSLALPVLLANTALHAKVVAVAVLTAAAAWTAGIAPLGWARTPRSLAAFAAYPAGYALVSMSFLGLALAGLWFPGVLAAALLLPAAAAILRFGRRVIPRAVPFPAPGRPLGLVVLALAGAAAWSLAPETHPDGWEYFLAGPSRWLAARRYSVLGASPPLHYPDIAEMLYSVPLMLGAGQAAKWLNALAMLSGAAAVASLMPREHRGYGLLLFVTAATPVYLSTTGKNEGFAAGFVLLATACGWRGSWTAGGLFAGLALSTKYLSVLNLAWLPLLLTTGRRGAQGLRVAALALVTTAPWWTKAWFLTGDPAYPVASGFFPRLIEGWDDRNARVWHLCTAVDSPAGSWPVRALQGLVQEHGGLALLLPALVMEGGRSRLVALGSVAVYAAWQAGFPGPQTVRWAFPGVAAALVLCGGPAYRWMTGPLLLRGALAACWLVAAGFSFVRLAGDRMNPFPYALGCEGASGYLARAFTTYAPAADAVRAGPRGGAVLLVGEVRELGLPQPCRLASAHASGEAPLLWRIVNASATGRDIRVRLRQLGVRRMLYNYVTVKNIQFCHDPFRWDDRMLRLYADWCRRHLVPVRVFDRADFSNGGFIVYEVEPRPVANPPRESSYLPGAEAYCHTAVPARNKGRLFEALRAHEALVELCPAVLSFRAELGHTLEMAQDWPRAYAELSGAIRGGFAEPFHLVNYGLAALQLGKYAEADAALTRCLTGAPSHAGAVRVALGWARYGLALEAGKRRDIKKADTLLSEAEGYLRDPAGPPGDKIEGERQRRRAYVRGLQGDIARARGENARAILCYRDAASLMPGTGEAGIWLEVAGRLGGR